MPGTLEGGRKAAITNKQKYGKDFYKRIGTEGGKVSKTGGFASNFKGADGLTGPQRAAQAGRRGGLTSSRSKDKLPLEFRQDIADFKQGFDEPTFMQRVVRRFTNV